MYTMDTALRNGPLQQQNEEDTKIRQPFHFSREKTKRFFTCQLIQEILLLSLRHKSAMRAEMRPIIMVVGFPTTAAMIEATTIFTGFTHFEFPPLFFLPLLSTMSSLGTPRLGADIATPKIWEKHPTNNYKCNAPIPRVRGRHCDVHTQVRSTLTYIR